jgi:phosphoribosylamine---glycine ligase
MRNVLLIDHSGRGHSFAELFSRTNQDVLVHYVSGCEAITTDRVLSNEAIALNDADAQIAYALEKNVDFVFVANTIALTNGFADRFRAAGLRVIGPELRASRLESSKTFGKEFCTRHGIRVSEWRSFDDADAAKAYVRSVGHQVVVKADGLCGGNGSIVCDTDDDAVAAIDKLMVERFFDAAGERVVIEKRLFGRELSFFILVDENGYQMLPMALDYPKSDDFNLGVTSGGMGALSPHPLESPEMYRMAEEQLVRPVLDAIRRDGMLYTGILYLGTMLVGETLYLLEINVRLGDPEAEVVTSRIKSDFHGLCLAILEGRLGNARVELDDLHYCNVVASQGRTRQFSKDGGSKGWYRGWPYGRFGKGYPVTGVDDVDLTRCKVFIGEAAMHPQKGLVTDGGRVIHVVGFAERIEEAVQNAYDNIGRIHFNGIRYRHDIGKVMPWDVFDLPAIDTPSVPAPAVSGAEAVVEE